MNRSTPSSARMPQDRGLILLALLGFIICTWLPRILTAGDSDVNVSVLLTVLIPLLALFYLAQEPRPFVFAQRRDTLVLSFTIGVMVTIGLLALASMLQTEDKLRVFRVAYPHGMGVIVLLGMYLSLYSWSSICLTRRVLLACAVVSCLVSLLIFFLVPPLRSTFMLYDRVCGTFKNPNQFGMALSTVMPLAAVGAFGPVRRGLWSAIVLILLTGIVLTGSKANILVSAMTFVIAGILVYWYQDIRIRPLRLLMILPLSALLATSGYFLLQVLNPRALTLLTALFQGSTDELHSLSSRQVLWSESIQQGLRHPLTGVGAGSKILGIPHSHNLFIDYFRTMGLPGLFLISVLLGLVGYFTIVCLWTGYRSRHAPLPARLAMIGPVLGVWSYLLSNQSSDCLGPSTIGVFWLLLGLLFVQYRWLTLATPASEYGSFRSFHSALPNGC